MFNLSQRTVVFAVLFVVPLLAFTYWDLVIASYRYQTETSIVISQENFDHLNATITAEQTRYFYEKMVESETRLKQAKQALLTFQQTNRLLTTASESSVVLTDISALETQLGKNKSEFGSLANTLTPDAPRLQQMKSDIESLEAQISIEKDRLSGASTASISELDARSRDILLNLE